MISSPAAIYEKVETTGVVSKWRRTSYARSGFITLPTGHGGERVFSMDCEMVCTTIGTELF